MIDSLDPRISIVLCTYNGEKYLREQIDSILEQTVVPHELIIYDDDSVDNTREILRSVVTRKGCKVRIFFNEVNVGFTKNFEKAVATASGDIIFFSDQDDLWLSNKIFHMIGLFKEHPYIYGITHDGLLVDSELRWNGATKSSQIERGYGTKVNEITGALSAIRRRILQLYLPIPHGIIGHDKWLTYIFSLFPGRWLQSQMCLQLIRRHSTNTSEWVVNSAKPINRFDVLIAEISTTAATVYHDRRLMNETIRTRLKDNLLVDGIFTVQEIAAAFDFLSNELIAINGREALVQEKSLWRRCRGSLEFWFSGGYNYFNGMRSLARDLLR